MERDSEPSSCSEKKEVNFPPRQKSMDRTAHMKEADRNGPGKSSSGNPLGVATKVTKKEDKNLVSKKKCEQKKPGMSYHVDGPEGKMTTLTKKHNVKGLGPKAKQRREKAEHIL